MKNPQYLLLFLLVALWSVVPPRKGQSQGNTKDTVPAVKAMMSKETFMKEQQIAEKDKKIDSLVNTNNAPVLKQISTELDISNKILSRTDRTLTRTIKALRSPEVRISPPLAILTPVSYSVPESRPMVLPEVEVPKKEESFFRRFIDWFK